jgi:hypothetical protein
MARTFLEVSKLANFTEEKVAPTRTKPEPEIQEYPEPVSEPHQVRETETPIYQLPRARLIDGVTYRIEVVLPAVRDKAVYDAIFRSIKEHLL